MERATWSAQTVVGSRHRTRFFTPSEAEDRGTALSPEPSPDNHLFLPNAAPQTHRSEAPVWAPRARGRGRSAMWEL